MALKNVPFRSDVLAWDPDSLADYFRKLNYRDCEKAVKKHHIDGQRFLNLTENDIQKFPKLRVPILSKLSQEINKNEERRSIFTRKPQVQRFPEETESHEEDNGGWSSFEEDDYESPTDDQNGDDNDDDYESPNEEDEAPAEDDADYEPPPSNDEEALQNSILPAKPFPNSNSTYIDRPPSSKVPQQPPVPPQRPMAVLPPPPVGRSHTPLPPPQPNHEEPSRSRNHKTAKLPAPSIDRSTKPPLDRSLAPFDREPFALGKKLPFPDKVSCLPGSFCLFLLLFHSVSCVYSLKSAEDTHISSLLSYSPWRPREAGLSGSIYPRCQSLLYRQPPKGMTGVALCQARSHLCPGNCLLSLEVVIQSGDANSLPPSSLQGTESHGCSAGAGDGFAAGA
ncbi:lymphocyte cytosolic protein 2 isoform X2 [Ursus arctos]|uniref:lymphocyte cytosolic protein 2 isoform X2 n=1 Tax=Ursus arctos TaxID=9644 RepID=UPI002547EE2A|nr:lymphocyte cytosolic protein 2 isoform X2 [Ursus arctos]